MYQNMIDGIEAELDRVPDTKRDAVWRMGNRAIHLAKQMLGMERRLELEALYKREYAAQVIQMGAQINKLGRRIHSQRKALRKAKEERDIYRIQKAEALEKVQRQADRITRLEQQVESLRAVARSHPGHLSPED